MNDLTDGLQVAFFKRLIWLTLAAVRCYAASAAAAGVINRNAGCYCGRRHDDGSALMTRGVTA